MTAKKGPLSEIQGDVKRHTAQPVILTSPEGTKITNEQLKMVGQATYSTHDEKCKENFGKPLSEILVLVPEARSSTETVTCRKKEIETKSIEANES